MELKEVLVKNNFRFKKALGQNFISDGNLLNAIVFDAGITEEDTVVEIGTGGGTLTAKLCKKAKRVISFEVDNSLEPIIREMTSGCDNLTLHFLDVLKLSDDDFRVLVPEPFKVVANLPYYITTPLIMRFIESSLDVKSLTLMMQKEVADRIVAKHDTKDYGSLTVSINSIADAEIVRSVSRFLFYPVPNVDSAIVRIDVNKSKYNFADYNTFKKVAKSAFLMRRKTLVNNLISVFSLTKSDCEKILLSLNFSPMIRGEALSIEDMILLSDAIFRYNN